MCRTGKLRQATSTTSMALNGKSFQNQALYSELSPSKLVRMKKKKINAFGLRTNRFREERHDIPGPGKYHRPMCIATHGIAVSRSQRFFSEKQQERLESFRPGPGSYNPLIEGCFSSIQTLSNEPRNAMNSAKKKRYIKANLDFPGPGHYDTYGLEERKGWGKSFSYSFKSIERASNMYGHEKTLAQNVAPGSYNVSRATDALHNYGSNVGQIGAVFRSKTDRWNDKMPMTTPAPGQYDIGSSFNDPSRIRPLSVFSSSLDRFGISPYKFGQKEIAIIDELPGSGWYSPKQIDFKIPTGAVAAFKSKTKRLVENDKV